MGLNTNILSLTTQNNLRKAQAEQAAAMTALSSGKRINNAKDDASGQSIVNNFTAQINGLKQASRNAQDGISITQTTEGSLNEINANLQRIRELVVQAQNGTNSFINLTSIQNEIKQRVDEIDRNSAQSSFNGINVMASDRTLKIQVGANDGENISINLKRIDASSLGLNGFSVRGSVVNTGNALTEIGDTTAAPQEVNLSAAAASLTTADGKKVDASSLSLHNLHDSSGAGTAHYVVKHGADCYAASVDKATGSVTLNTADITYTDPDNGMTADATVSSALLKVGTNAVGENTTYATISGKNYAIQGGLANSCSATASTSSATLKLSGAGASDEFTGAATNNPLKLLDDALGSINAMRSDLGAVQNRLGSSINNLENNIIDLTESRSRMEDADYPSTVTKSTTYGIIVQAANSVLAKVNQIPQYVLSLLQN